jgi:hypothetical protein
MNLPGMSATQALYPAPAMATASTTAAAVQSERCRFKSSILDE